MFLADKENQTGNENAPDSDNAVADNNQGPSKRPKTKAKSKAESKDQEEDEEEDEEEDLKPKRSKRRKTVASQSEAGEVDQVAEGETIRALRQSKAAREAIHSAKTDQGNSVEGHEAAAAVLNAAASASAAAGRTYKNGDTRDGWIFDSTHRAFFPPPCASTGTKNQTCTKCGSRRLKDKDEFFADENGAKIVFKRSLCIKCLKREYGNKSWKDYPTPPWEKKDDGSDKSGGGSGGGAPNAIAA